jgi:hypothetical protein
MKQFFGTPVSWDRFWSFDGKCFYYTKFIVRKKAMFVFTSSQVSDQSETHSPVDSLVIMKEMKYCKTDEQICYNTSHMIPS